MVSEQSSMRSILIVDDDVNFAQALAELLTDRGYRVAAVSCGGKALAHLRSCAPPHLILLDLRMPTMNGWALHAELASDPNLAAIPVILLSAAQDLASEAAKLGVSGFLPKPVDFRLLLKMLEQL